MPPEEFLERTYGLVRENSPFPPSHPDPLGITTLVEPVWDISDSGWQFSSEGGVQQGAHSGMMPREKCVHS